MREQVHPPDQGYSQVPNPGPSNDTYSTGSAATDRGASGEWVLFCAVLVFLICSLGVAYLFSIDKDFSAFAYLLLGIAVVLTILSHGRYTSTRTLHGTATFFHRLQSCAGLAQLNQARLNRVAGEQAIPPEPGSFGPSRCSIDGKKKQVIRLEAGTAGTSAAGLEMM